MKEHQINRIRSIVDSRLRPDYLGPIAGIIVVLTLLLAVVMSVSSPNGKTFFGIPFGADFAGFYVAAQILNRQQPQRLYDRELHHQMYHELLPDEDERVVIPYVHPPFVAALLRPLARWPYATAVVAWMAISAALYLIGVWLMLNSLPWLITNQRWLIVLLACAFEPFAFECWLGGQLSSIGFFSFALCFAAARNGLSFWSGVALGICFYKPTLLLLVLPLLVIGRRWSMLLGMTVTGLLLAATSWLLVGWNVNIGYLHQLLSFNQSMTGGTLEIRTWKYVDLNNCLRPWLGSGSPLLLPTAVAVGLMPFLQLCRLWWDYDRYDDRDRRLLWAATLSWTPILNVYFGIYDSILVLQSVYVCAVLICTGSSNATPLTSSGFAYLLLALYAFPWFSQHLAAITGLPLYTLLLAILGAGQLGILLKAQSQSLQPLRSGR